MRQLKEIEEMFSQFAQAGDGDSTFQSSGDASTAEAVQAFCKQYCVLLSYQATYQCYIRHLGSIGDAAEQWSVKLTQIRGLLEKVAGNLISPEFQSDSIPQPVVDAFDKQLRTQHSKLLGTLECDKSGATKLQKEICNAATNFFVSAANLSSGIRSGAVTGGSNSFPQNA